jgi:hypothetical protein
LDTSQGKFELADPNPAALVEALRAFGYTTEAAIADLIDNSIAAGARNVWLTFYWAGRESFVSVRDDGRGMSEAELRNAMRPGSTHPLEERDPKDLGRFGLGLKTASFSQCRRLTVHSKSAKGRAVTRRWDLDYVNKTREWRLLKTPAEGSIDRLKLPPAEQQGTVVLWEDMDRIVEDFEEGNLPAKKRFLELAESVEQHIGMVFHRFLEGRPKFTIWVGDRPVDPWNPFLPHEEATQQLATERLTVHGKRLTVIPFVLPHHSKLDVEVHTRAAGPRGWNAHQGFYIYRNKRLLVPGDWLNLGMKKEEHYKLARIQVDIPNSMDEEWSIDVRKSRARPPGALRDDFYRVAQATRQRAVEIYRHRGKQLARKTSDDHVFVWSQTVKHGKVSYRLNREHPLVKAAFALPRDHQKVVKSLVRLMEETVPVPLIVVDAAERPDKQRAPFEATPSSEVVDVLSEVYRALRAGGLSMKQAKRKLLSMEPFQLYPELIESIVARGEER